MLPSPKIQIHSRVKHLMLEMQIISPHQIHRYLSIRGSFGSLVL